jgi:hypothetical protein
MRSRGRKGEIDGPLTRRERMVFRASSGPFVAPARAYVDAGTVTGTEPSTVHSTLLFSLGLTTI